MSKLPVEIADRMSGIAPFQVMEIMVRAREAEARGQSVIHMEVGEPDFCSPLPVIEAGRQALAEGKTQYTTALGLSQLREAIADWYRRCYGVDVPMERVVITTGSSAALQMALAVLVNHGERVLVTDPGYPCNRHFVNMFGGQAVSVPVAAEKGFQLTAAQLQEAAAKKMLRAVMLASPSNPTGAVIAPETLKELVATTESVGARLIMDEIYHGLVYGVQNQTALSYTDQAFVVNSFSKFFGMTGWRLGWLIVPPGYEREIEKLAQNMFIAPPTVAQYAALAALQDESLAVLQERAEQFRQRRDVLLAGLRDIGFGVPHTPEGAFYIYADCSAFSDDSYEFAAQTLANTGVAITPGNDFGSVDAERFVRFAYTTDLEKIEEALQRLKAWLKP